MGDFLKVFPSKPNLEPAEPLVHIIYCTLFPFLAYCTNAPKRKKKSLFWTSSSIALSWAGKTCGNVNQQQKINEHINYKMIRKTIFKKVYMIGWWWMAQWVRNGKIVFGSLDTVVAKMYWWQKNVTSISSIELSKGTVGSSQIVKIEMFWSAPAFEIPATLILTGWYLRRV